MVPEKVLAARFKGQRAFRDVGSPTVAPKKTPKKAQKKSKGKGKGLSKRKADVVDTPSKRTRAQGAAVRKMRVEDFVGEDTSSHGFESPVSVSSGNEEEQDSSE